MFSPLPTMLRAVPGEGQVVRVFCLPAPAIAAGAYLAFLHRRYFLRIKHRGFGLFLRVFGLRTRSGASQDAVRIESGCSQDSVRNQNRELPSLLLTARVFQDQFPYRFFRSHAHCLLLTGRVQALWPRLTC